MSHHDPTGKWIQYHGAIKYEQLHPIYENTDLAIWASTCETFGLILLESMASGLPIACSNRGPMSEILGSAGVYFDPEKPTEVASSMKQLIDDPSLRKKLAKESYDLSKQYTWKRCADETFEFISQVHKQSSAR
jgi:glycosyltransferase involved in cell wall biosynthesis